MIDIELSRNEINIEYYGLYEKNNGDIHQDYMDYPDQSYVYELRSHNYYLPVCIYRL